jgi:hypothetical protein
MELRVRVFESNWTLTAILAACILESVMSGRSLGTPATSIHDAVRIFGLIASGAVLTLSAFRVRRAMERAVLGTISAAVALWAILGVFLPSPSIVGILAVVDTRRMGCFRGDERFYPVGSSEESRASSRRTLTPSKGSEKAADVR